MVVTYYTLYTSCGCIIRDILFRINILKLREQDILRPGKSNASVPIIALGASKVAEMCLSNGLVTKVGTELIYNIMIKSDQLNSAHR